MKTKFNLRKRLFPLLFAFFLVFSAFLPVTTAYASSVDDVYEFDNTDIEQDLENVDLKPFKLAGKTDVIMLVERGFQTSGDFGLWIYVYNSSKATLKESNSNVVNMANGYDEENKPISYGNVKIQFCSHTIDYSVYKYRIVDSDGEIRKRAVNQNVLHGERRYDIAGVQLTKSSDGTVTDYPVSKSYFYSGDMAEKNLVINELETIELTVKPLWYRTASSSTGKNYRHQLNAVYFGVDDTVLQKHGKLQKVKAEWYEYKTQPIIVLQDKEVYDAFLPYAGVDIGDYNEDLPYYVGANRKETFLQSSGKRIYTYDWSYNLPSDSGSYDLSLNTNEEIFKLYYFFHTGGENFSDYKVSSETLSNYIYNYKKTAEKGFLPIKNGDISADLFLDTVDAGRTKGYNLVEIDADEKFDLMSYDETHNFWQTVGDYGIWDTLFGLVPSDESIQEIQPIYQVKSSDVTDVSTASKNLFIDEALTQEFINDVNVYDQEGKTTFIFRFASTDYYSAYVDVVNGIAGGYCAQETVFLDFDIISLTFRNDVGDTVIPVVSSPIDIIPGLDPPPNIPTAWWIYMAVIGGAAVLGFILSIVLKGEGI